MFFHQPWTQAPIQMGKKAVEILDIWSVALMQLGQAFGVLSITIMSKMRGRMLKRCRSQST